MDDLAPEKAPDRLRLGRRHVLLAGSGGLAVAAVGGRTYLVEAPTTTSPGLRVPLKAIQPPRP